VLGINPAAEDLLNISADRALQTSCLQLFDDDDELRRLLDDSSTSGATYASELRLGQSDTRTDERVVEYRVSRMDANQDEDNSEHVLLIELTDVTRRSRISRENALLTQHGAGRQMIRQLAHEIKNPLGGLRGAAQLLARELHDPSLNEYTDVIISEADRLASLVDTLLGPGGPLQKSFVNVHELLEYVIRLQEPAAGEKISFHRDYDPGLPAANVDRDRLVQALLNLVHNACGALDGQGNIVLRTRAEMNFTIGAKRHRIVATIEIEDDGPGIPAELQDTVFYPLVTGRPDGTGLGLPTAQELISRHGGLIEFESRPGRTVFQVRIPIDDEVSNDG